MPLKENSIEGSLRTYLQYLYIEYPPNVVIKINGIIVDLKNPYAEIKKTYPNSLGGNKTDRYAT